MPEIELRTRRWARRLQRHFGVVLLCAVGIVAMGSLVVVVLSLTQESGVPYAYVPPVVTTDDEDGDVGGASLVPERPLSPESSPESSPEALPEIVPVSLPSAGQEASTADDSVLGQDAADDPAGDPAGESAGDPAGAPTDAPIDGPTADPGTDGEESGQDDDRPGVKRFLAPTEELVLQVLEATAPGLTPVAGDVFETTGGLLDTVESVLPRSPSPRRP